MAYVGTNLQIQTELVSKEWDSESDPKMEVPEPISTLLDEINQIMPNKNQLEELIDDKEAMQILLEKMGKWFLANMDKTLEIIKKGLAKDYIMYQELCCIMTDLSAPFRCFEICAAALKLSLQETGMISIEEMMKILPSTTDPTICYICGLGMTKSGDEIPVITANTPDLVKASDKTASKPLKSEQCGQIFLKSKKNDETDDATIGKKPAFTGLVQKPTQEAFPGFARKPTQEAFSGFARKPTQEPFSGFARKPTQEPFSGFARKPTQEAFSGFARKPTQEPFSGFARKPTQEAFSRLSKKPTQEAFSRLSKKPTQEAFSGLSKKPTQAAFSGLSKKPTQAAFSGLSKKPTQAAFSGLSKKPTQEAFSGLSKKPTYMSKATFGNKLELKGGGEKKITDQNSKDSKCLKKLIQAVFSGFVKKSTHINKATFENKLELKGGGEKKLANRNSKEPKCPQKHSASNQSLSILGENKPVPNKGNIPFPYEKKHSLKLSVDQLSITNKLDPVQKLDIQNENTEVKDQSTYEEMIRKMTKPFEKSIPGIIASDTNKFPMEAKSDQIKILSPFEMENEAKLTAALLTQPIIIERFVLVQLKFVIYCDIAACDSHFSVLLNSEACVSYLVHRIREVSDANSQEIYLSPNRLRLRQMLLPHDRSLKDCGYQGYCKSHPQKITLYYDYDKHYKPGFIEILD